MKTLMICGLLLSIVQACSRPGAAAFNPETRDTLPFPPADTLFDLSKYRALFHAPAWDTFDLKRLSDWGYLNNESKKTKAGFEAYPEFLQSEQIPLEDDGPSCVNILHEGAYTGIVVYLPYMRDLYGYEFRYFTYDKTGKRIGSLELAYDIGDAGESSVVYGHFIDDNTYQQFSYTSYMEIDGDTIWLSNAKVQMWHIQNDGSIKEGMNREATLPTFVFEHPGTVWF